MLMSTGYLIKTRSRTAGNNKNSDIEEKPSENIELQTIEKMATKIEVEELFKMYRKEMTRGTEPGIFTGRISENAREWIHNFESYCELNNINEEAKILTFSLLVKYGAKSLFNSLSDNERKSWDTIKAKFTTTYMENNNWINEQRLENRRLQAGETCEKYIADLTELSLLIGMDDRELKNCLIRGLPEQLKWNVIGFNPGTVNETIQRILLAEATIKGSNQQEVSTTSQTSQLIEMMSTITERLDRMEMTQRTSRAATWIPIIEGWHADIVRRRTIPRRTVSSGTISSR